MVRFIVRRIIQMALVVVVLSLLLFFWLRSLPGGTVSALLGERATPSSRARLEAALGLDEPLYVQYWRFLERALSGDFGASTAVLPGTDALDIFLQRLPATIELAIFAMRNQQHISASLESRQRAFDHADAIGNRRHLQTVGKDHAIKAKFPA